MKQTFFLSLHGLIIFMTCFFCQPMAAQEKLENNPNLIEKEKYYSSIGVTEITLGNGMRVILKPTDYDSDEIYIRLSAKGGYAYLGNEKQVSGMLSAQVAWESGVGDMTSDKVSSILFKKSLELAPKINSFSRIIEGSTSLEGLETFFNFTNLLFTSSRFTQEAFKTILQQTKEKITEKQTIQNSTEYTFHDFNSQSQNDKNLTLKNLESFDFQTAKVFFDSSYSSPADFVCVIVGNFNLETIKPLIIRYFANIPLKATTFPKETQSPVNNFPEGITSKIIKMPGRTKCLTRLTFPLKLQLDEDKMQKLQIACRLIENRLRSKMVASTHGTRGIDVSYEFPYFPALDSWVTVQFCSKGQDIESVKSLIIKELRHLQTHDFSQKEIDEAQSKLIQSDECWLKDNFSWIGVLTNYYLWKWNPEEIVNHPGSIKKEDMQSLIQNSLSLDNYSIISIQPQ